MPMSATNLANEIKSAMANIDFENGEISNDDLIQALASTIVDHIKNNAEAVDPGGTAPGQWSII